jgi:poly(A) polymerase
MLDSGVLGHFLPEAADVDRLQALSHNEKLFAEPVAPLVRLAALLPQDKAVADAVATRLKLSRRDAEALAVLSILPERLSGNLSPVPLRRMLYLHGMGACRAAVFLRGEAIAEAVAVIEAWENPVFPLRGEDIVALGVAAGPRVGMILRSVEEWWIAGDFRANRAQCLRQAQDAGKNP